MRQANDDIVVGVVWLMVDGNRESADFCIPFSSPLSSFSFHLLPSSYPIINIKVVYLPHTACVHACMSGAFSAATHSIVYAVDDVLMTVM